MGDVSSSDAPDSTRVASLGPDDDVSCVGAGNEFEDASGASGDEEDSQRPRNPRPKKRCRTLKDLAIETPRALPPRDSAEYRYNVKHSHLHQLPAELMLDIFCYISESAVSVLTMQLVARDFYPFFPPPLIIGREERDAFKAALRRDDAHWFSKRESLEKFGDLSQAYCSACMSRHSISQFTSDETAKPTQERMCVGAQETIKMHDERRATLNQIWDLALNHTLTTAFLRTYVSKASTHTLDPSTTKPSLETLIAHVLVSRKLDVSLHFRMLTLPRATRVRGRLLSDPLASMGHLLCPTLQAELSLWNEGPNINCANYTLGPDNRSRTYGTIRLYDRYGYKCHPCSCSLKEEKSCASFFSIYQRDSETLKDSVDIFLSVFKPYMPPEDDADPSWSDNIVQELVDSQHALNVAGGGASIAKLYKAKRRGEWTWDEPELEVDRDPVQLGTECVRISKTAAA